MIDSGGGSIVNFHSVEGMRGYPGEPVYGAMKGAVAHFTTCLAAEQGRNGIRVNGIGPDLTQTPQVDYGPVSEHDHMWESWAPVGRLGWPEDQARVALFLASDMSAYVTGHNIPVDGGTKTGGGWFWSPSVAPVHQPPDDPLTRPLIHGRDAANLSGSGRRRPDGEGSRHGSSSDPGVRRHQPEGVRRGERRARHRLRPPGTATGPTALVSHSAGLRDDGHLVVMEVWDSPEHQARFMEVASARRWRRAASPSRR